MFSDWTELTPKIDTIASVIIKRAMSTSTLTDEKSKPQLFELPRFKDKSSILVYGQSHSGKSYMVRKFLADKHRYFERPFATCIYCYGVFDESLNEMRDSITDINFILHPGVPSMDLFESITTSFCVVFDDLLTHMNSVISDFFIMNSKHINAGRGCTVFLIVQDMHGNKFLKLCRRNRDVLILTHSPVDQSTMALENSRMFPNRKKFLQTCMQMAVDNMGKYPHLIVDSHPRASKELTVYSDVFNKHGILSVYKPAKM